MRLIQDDGEQIGIVSIDEARERAKDRGMDLVEVAAEARPPVVKMMDYGKYKYEAARAAREARKKQHTIKVKEVKFRPGIEDHDYDFKVGHARRFLDEGNKVKLTMMFRAADHPSGARPGGPPAHYGGSQGRGEGGAARQHGRARHVDGRRANQDEIDRSPTHHLRWRVPRLD